MENQLLFHVVLLINKQNVHVPDVLWLNNLLPTAFKKHFYNFLFVFLQHFVSLTGFCFCILVSSRKTKVFQKQCVVPFVVIEFVKKFFFWKNYERVHLLRPQRTKLTNKKMDNDGKIDFSQLD